MPKFLLVFCLAVLTLVSPALAQRSDADLLVDQGNAALAKSDFATALSIYRPLAEAGNARAQANLASMYDHGWGVELSYETAVMWLTKSADQGQPLAALRLGEHYDLGKGVATDKVKALHYFEIGANGGNGTAAFYAGTMHMNGEGAVPVYSRARAFFKMGAELGNKDAANAYGYFLENGYGGDVDIAEAKKWYDFAIAEGDTMATRNKSTMVKRAVARGDEHASIGHYDSARYAYDFACLNDLGDGCYRLAGLFYSGQGGPTDKSKSLTLAGQACDLGITDACGAFGDLVIELRRTGADSKRAVGYLEAMCANGEVAQCHNLAYLRLNREYGVYDYARGKTALMHGCTGGYGKSCGPYNDMTRAENAPAANSGNSSNGFTDFLNDFLDGMMAESASYSIDSTSCGSCGSYDSYSSYSSSSSSGTDSFASTNQAQDNRDFDVFIQSHSSYGGICPASNPYC